MKRSTVSEGIKRLAFAAMLTAMSVVIGIFCKTALNFADGLFRITFENMPIILAGIIFGPIVGGAVGVASDLLSYLLSGQTYPPNLVVTLGAAVIGIIAGIVAKYIIRKRGTLQFIVAGASAHLVGSVIIKSVGLFIFYNWLVLWRIPTYLVITTVEVILLILLYKNKAIKKIIDKLSPVKESARGYDSCTHRAEAAINDTDEAPSEEDILTDDATQNDDGYETATDITAPKDNGAQAASEGDSGDEING